MYQHMEHHIYVHCASFVTESWTLSFPDTSQGEECVGICLNTVKSLAKCQCFGVSPKKEKTGLNATANHWGKVLNIVCAYSRPQKHKNTRL